MSLGVLVWALGAILEEAEITAVGASAASLNGVSSQENADRHHQEDEEEYGESDEE